MTDTIQLKQAIEQVAEKSCHFFTDEAQNSQTSTWIKEEGLGIALSQWSGWDGEKLMRVFRSALEDCNYHTEAAAVNEMLKALGAETNVE